MWALSRHPLPRGAVRRLRPARSLAWGTALLALAVLPGLLDVPSAATAAPPSHVGAAAPGPTGPEAAAAVPGPAELRPQVFATVIAGLSPAAIALAWNATTDPLFSNYTVQRSDNGSSGPWRTVGVVTPQSTTGFTLGGLGPGAAYSWRVVEHGAIASQTAATASAVQPALATLNATMLGPTSARFNWTNAASYGGPLAFSSYELEEAGGGAGYSTVATVTAATTLSTTVTGLSASASYQFFLNTSDCLAACNSSRPTESVTASNVVTIGTPLPLAVTVGATRTVVDLGQSDYFTCTAAGGSAPFGYAWTEDGGTLPTTTSSLSLALDSPGNTTVGCTVTDALGSQATAATVIEVRPYPTVAVTANRTAVDAGESVGFTCVISEGTAPYVTQWDFGDGTTTLALLPAHAYSSAGSYVPTCSAVDATGASLAASLWLNVSPALSAAVSAPFAGAAPGSALPLAVVFFCGSGTYLDYTWAFGDGQTASGPTVSHGYASAGNFTVTLVVNDSNGMAARGTAGLTILPLVGEIVASVHSLEAGGAVDLTARATGGAGGYNYSWDFGDGTNAFGASVRHSYASAGDYRPLLRVRDALGATGQTNGSAIAVSAAPTPVAYPTLAIVLLLALAVGTFVGLVAWGRERRRPLRAPPNVAGYVPPTDPSTSIHGVKVCRGCGTANVVVRTTCTHCGAPLPRSP